MASGTDRHRTLAGEVRDIARSEVLPHVSPGGHGRVDRGLVAALGDAGLLRRILPERFGGTAPSEPSAADLCAIREGLASESTAAETAFALQGLGAYPLLTDGTDRLRERYLPGVGTGSLVAAFALTEPEAGSDAAAITLAATPHGTGYRLTGTKKWISNAPEADFYTLFARTTEGARARGVTAFVVPGDSAGLSGRPLDLIGGHAIGTLELDDVYVPGDAVLGTVDHGFSVAMRTLNRFRPSVGAGAVGMAQAALEHATAHARTRQAFGQPIGNFQAVAHPLAEAATQLTAARLLVTEAARAHDQGDEDAPATAAMAKLYATEVASTVVDTAVQTLGAAGLEVHHKVAQLYDEVRALRIYEGTSEIQRTIIARHLLR